MDYSHEFIHSKVHLRCQVSTISLDTIYWSTLLNFCTNPTGFAAPAIAAGFTALVPTLHTFVPLIGASGFAAIATAAGHTAGSVAVAASFGGEPNKMLPEYYSFSSFHIFFLDFYPYILFH